MPRATPWAQTQAARSRLARHGRPEALPRPGRDRGGPGRVRAARARRRARRARRLAGRAMARREMGKLVFLDLVDRSGRIQVICDDAVTGEIDVHLGDVVGVRGRPAKSRRGEPSRARRELEVLARNTQPLPDTFHGAHRRRAALPQALPRPADERGDARRLPLARQGRHGDPRARSTSEGFVEVETPVLQPRYGGAFARPFVTHSQRARRRPLPADRDRALPQAADRRRARARLRARQGLPQRGRLVQAQPRVHDARVVRGVRRLPRHDGAHRAARRARRARGARDDRRLVPRARARPAGAVAARPLRRRARARTSCGRATPTSCAPG